ncbi:type IV secretion protein Rhs, partial [Nocardiopsis ansamitocini]|uniref:type IV secretion protein Rhs n=1 Tax=Nocardiopsis ansamitocini TaxID=1670832 RepID=UPI0025521424
MTTPAPLDRRAHGRTARLASAAMAVIMLVTLTEAMPPRPDWLDDEAPPIEDLGPAVVGSDAKVEPRVPGEEHEAAVTGPADVAWPTAAVTTVEVSESGAPRQGRVFAPEGGAAPLPRQEPGPVSVGGLPVTVRPAPGATGDGPEKVDVEVMGQDAAKAAGVQGLLLRVTRADGDPRPAGVELSLDYSDFADAYGGDFGARLDLVRLPACVLDTPQSGLCSTPRPVETGNDPEEHTLTAQVLADPVSRSRAPSPFTAEPSAAPAVYALAANASSSQGSYSATQLAPSSNWDVSLSSGDFSWNHPVEVPGVPGELEPAIDLGYSSQAVDGRTTATNNQGSWVGEGFSYEPGYIERSYKACADDGHKTLGDQCWGTDNATMMLGGSSGELIKDDATGRWRLKSDDGSKIERLTGAVNGDNDGEYWRVTTVEGIKYYFGFNRLPGWSSGKEETASAWTVPVFGDDKDEPCNKSTLAESWCQQAWRWNLDYVEDRHGNVMSYYYGKETNHYAREAKTDRNGTAYTRGGYLKRVDYGQRAGEVYSTTAPARVTFTVAERCLETGSFDCAPAKLTAANATHWPDVPFDLDCKADTRCAWAQTAPSFWTTKRLTDITTQVSTGSGYAKVDSFALKHLFTDNGDGSRTLWLSTITETGHVGGTQSLPAIELGGIQLPNRVDRPGDHISPLNRFRLSNIYTETGGQITVNYTGGECTPTTLPTPGESTGRCYPVKWSPPGAENPITDWFHKYVVTELIEEDRTGGAPEEYTRYEYLGDAGWRHDEPNGLTDAKHQTWGQWRGYGRVRVRSGGAQSMTGRTEHTFLRGLHGDKRPGGGTRSVTVTDSTGTEHTDHDDLAGFELEEIDYNGSAVVDKDVNVPWRRHTATRVEDWGTSRATFQRNATERSFTALASGGWQETRSTTTFDPETARETMVHDFGDVSTTADDQCVRTTYADNTAAGMLTHASRVEIVAVGCTTTPDRATDVLSDMRKHYDGQGFGAAPTKGDVTKVENLVSHDGTTPTYLTAEQTSYDRFGRVLEMRDSAGLVTETIAYTETNGLTTRIVGENALKHRTTMDLDPKRGVPVAEVDANNRRIDLAYDALGRLTQIWHPDRSRSRGYSPSQRFEYLISKDAPVAVKSEDLRNDGSYEPAYEIYDGFLRPRQVQTKGPDGGRLVTDTFYNAIGETAKTNDVYYAEGAPSASLLTVVNGSVNGQTSYTYDGVGRPTAVIQSVSGDEKWRSTASYGGDRVHVTPVQGGIPTTVITDARGQQTEKRQYKGATPTGAYDATTYTYTRAGQLESVTSPAGQTWRYRYDQRGRKIEAVDPDAGTSTFSYDDFDQLVSTTDARGVTVSNAYDLLGRLTATYEGSIATGTRLTAWEYDTRLKGQLYMETRHAGGEQYRIAVTERDDLYRPTRTVYGIPASQGALAGNYTFTATYNLDGTLRGVGMPAGGGLKAEALLYGYDDLQRPTTMRSAEGTYVTRTDYAQTGEPLQYQLSSGGPTTWLTYNYEKGTGRLLRSRAETQAPGSDKLDIRYGYDDAGTVQWVSDTPAGGVSETQCFEHDYLLRMTQAWSTGETGDDVCATQPTTETVGGPQPYWHSFTYDVSGNRLTETIHGVGSAAASAAAQQTAPSAEAEPAPEAEASAQPSPSLSPLPQTPSPSVQETAGPVPVPAPEPGPAPAPQSGPVPEPRPLQWAAPGAPEDQEAAPEATAPEAEQSPAPVGDVEEAPTDGQEGEPAAAGEEQEGEGADEAATAAAADSADTVRTYSYPQGGQPNTLSQVVEETPGGDRLYRYEYDESGNTVKRVIAGEEQVLTWTAEGKLNTADTAEGRMSFVYTPTGERLVRTDAQATTLYLPGMELRSEAGAVSGTRYYTHNDETVAVRTQADGLTFLAADHHGTAELAVDATTGETVRRRFTPFGEERGATQDVWPDDKGFLGKVVDASTGLSHLGAR